MKKICVVTGTRAEYGLLYWLIKEIDADDELELQLVVTGTHLSPDFEFTYKEIEKEFKIDKKIETLTKSDTAVGISKSMGLAQISFAETYDELKPDLIVVVGDSHEIFSAVSAAKVASIPIAHLLGGKILENPINEQIGHSITLMSHLHFTNNEEHRNRIIQLGAQPNTVHIVDLAEANSIKTIVGIIKNLNLKSVLKKSFYSLKESKS